MAIVFSGYDDFEYARRALKLGVQVISPNPLTWMSWPIWHQTASGGSTRPEKTPLRSREDLLRKLLMYEVSDSGPIKEMEHDYCMVLIFESPGQRPPMADRRPYEGTGAYVLVQRENLCEIAVISPTRMTVEMRASLFLSHTRQLFSEQGMGLTCARAMCSGASGCWTSVTRRPNLN